MEIIYNKAAEELINIGLAKLQKLNFTKRLYDHDATVWKTDEADKIGRAHV